MKPYVTAGVVGVGVVVGFLIGQLTVQNNAGNQILASLERQKALTVAIPEKDDGEPQFVWKEAPTVAIPEKDDGEPLLVLDSRTGKRLSPCTKATSCKVEVKLNKNGEPFLVGREGKPIKDAKVVRLYRFRYPGSDCEVWYYGGSSDGRYWYYNHCGQVSSSQMKWPWPAQGPPEERPPEAPK